ncbi:MAG: S41 family peptidase [Terricaulis sp.]
MSKISLSRRAVCAAGVSAVALPAWAEEPLHDTTFVQDFDELWGTLDAHYCFFGDKRTDWRRVRDMYRPMAIAVQTNDAFTDVVRRVLTELYDAHTHLSNPPDGAQRFPLYDLYAERRGTEIIVAAVKDNSSAADAGVGIGDAVLAIDDVPIEVAIAQVMPKCLRGPCPDADAYSINAALAGHTALPRRIDVRDAHGQTRALDLPLKRSAQQPDVSARALDGGLGYISIRSFENGETVDAFDTALETLRETRGLIIDVRNNGGGDTAVARPIMGRFITQTMPYAHMRRRAGRGLSAPWVETVDPRGPFTYAAPVVVLCNHWSGSMAEGFPMGMRDIGRARIVGTRMMGLGAAVFAINLDRTGIGAQYSGEPVYDTHDAPRWQLRPDVEVAAGDDILAAGVRELERLIHA